MKDYKCLVDTLQAVSGVHFGPATADELSDLKALGVPPAVMDFYAKHVPADTVERKVWLWCIRDVLREHRTNARVLHVKARVFRVRVDSLRRCVLL